MCYKYDGISKYKIVTNIMNLSYTIIHKILHVKGDSSIAWSGTNHLHWLTRSNLVTECLVSWGNSN